MAVIYDMTGDNNNSNNYDNINSYNYHENYSEILFRHSFLIGPARL